MGFKKYDGSTWQSINPKKLKGIPYSGTLPATLTGTKAGYLQRYKVYGNSSGGQECGERTENLLDEENYAGEGYLNASGTITPLSNYVISELIPVTGDVWLSFINTAYPDVTNTSVRIAFYDSNQNIIRSSWRERSNITATFSELYQKPSDGAYFRYNGRITNKSIMVNSGSTALPYEPYGYKLPLTSGSTPVDIYIGNDTLSTEEYVDSGTGKVYRMVGGVLTPADPPVPFPQISTTANSTTISWAGEGLAPSEFDSIQEWVDIPTYTRVNGEWVADT